jgi:hypothetical protein
MPMLPWPASVVQHDGHPEAAWHAVKPDSPTVRTRALRAYIDANHLDPSLDATSRR